MGQTYSPPAIADEEVDDEGVVDIETTIPSSAEEPPRRRPRVVAPIRKRSDPCPFFPMADADSRRQRGKRPQLAYYLSMDDPFDIFTSFEETDSYHVGAWEIPATGINPVFYTAIDSRFLTADSGVETKILMKKIPIMRDTRLRDLTNEIMIRYELARSRSPNIVGFLGSFSHELELYIAVENFPKGNLIDFLRSSRGGRPLHLEQEIGGIMRDVLQALVVVHSHSFMHGNLAPECLLVSDCGEIRLGGFHYSRELCEGGEKFPEMKGNLSSLAPETVNEDSPSYGTEVDIWALGICAFRLADGYLDDPWDSIRINPSPQLKGGTWGSDFRDFLRAALTEDPKLRPTASQLLEHPFVRRGWDTSFLIDFEGDMFFEERVEFMMGFELFTASVHIGENLTLLFPLCLQIG